MMVKSKILFLFLTLISFISCEIKWIDYDFSQNYAEYVHDKQSKKVSVGVDFYSSSGLPFYIKVTVVPEEGTPTPLLCFCPTDSSCNTGIEAIAKSTDGSPAVLFLKREQFEEENRELFILVTCQENDCGYTLKIYGTQSCELESNSVYSYLVTSYNREMRFEVKGDVEEGSYLTIGIDGSSTAVLNIDNVSENPYNLDTGKIITYPITSQNNGILSTFTITSAAIGDYINLSVHVVLNNKSPDNLLYPNGPIIMGMLNNGYFKEECFPISAFISDKFINTKQFYLTARIHSKYSLFWLADENDYYMDGTEKEISDGLLSFLIEPEGKMRSVCFEFSYESTVIMDYVAYSVSILEPIKLENFYNFYPPQINGQTYRRMIPKGSYGVYHGGKIDESNKKYNFNIYSREGVSEMYITKCTTFPNCTYTTDQLNQMTKIKRIGRQSIWETTVEKSGTYDALDSSKNVMIVYCKDDENENKGYCAFDTSIFFYQQTITLVENEKFSKFVLKGEKGIIKVDLKDGVKIKGLMIDIMIYSGDVDFELVKVISGLNYHKYYLSNKIFFYFDFGGYTLDYLELEYNPLLNSFFSVKYEVNSYNLNQIKEWIRSGENDLVQIDPTSVDKYKTIYLEKF